MDEDIEELEIHSHVDNEMPKLENSRVKLQVSINWSGPGLRIAWSPGAILKNPMMTPGNQSRLKGSGR